MLVSWQYDECEGCSVLWTERWTCSMLARVSPSFPYCHVAKERRIQAGRSRGREWKECCEKQCLMCIYMRACLMRQKEQQHFWVSCFISSSFFILRQLQTVLSRGSQCRLVVGEPKTNCKCLLTSHKMLLLLKQATQWVWESSCSVTAT